MATTHATPYTFTEKMRIRKSFAKRASVLQVPFLLETQLASYRAFLQEFTPGMERIGELLAGGSDQADLPPPKARRPGAVEVWSRLFLSDGLELHIDPSRAQLAPEQVRQLARAVMAAYEHLNKENKQ